MTVLINRNMYFVDIGSAENFVLSAFLDVNNITAKSVTVTIISTAVIGSKNTALPAFSTGNLSGREIIVNNYGEIQGAGGAPTRNGGNALSITSPITFNNFGAIRSGGGGGRTGGTGASGYWITGWGPNKWRTGTNKSGWYRYSAGCSDFRAYYDNKSIGYICMYPYLKNGSYYYTFGPSGPSPFGGFNYIKRSTGVQGYGGSGGVGGRGRGYGQSRHNGTGGNAGSNYGGRGGKGGNGGWWGATSGVPSIGGKGSAFGDGQYASFGGTRYKRVSTNPPAYSTTKYAPGKSIIVSSGVTLICDVTKGTINGPTSGAIVAPVPAQKLHLDFLKAG